MTTCTPRHSAVQQAGKRYPKLRERENPADSFGKHVFTRTIMQKMLPPEIYQDVLDAMEGRAQIKKEHADSIAMAMKEWATSLGATHFTHWFQPQTGSTAEKHDCFVAWNTNGEVIEEFCGQQLVQGEPDASSFPSGGLRSTYEARGYTGWDPTSMVFLWQGGDGLTLCIPSVFFSWTGDILDNKIPLLRSDQAIDRAVLRLLKKTGVQANHVFSTLGLEQEYFVIDRALRDMRPDLTLLGKTVLGAPSPKGQELQDHYFGTVKDRILCFMQDFEQAALYLGIPLKTRHNEVAPAQHEVAQVFEKASAAIDHNILLMELMRQIALKHDLACLLHEKPFKDLNGSGKHSNWSLMTDTGLNLLIPSDKPYFLFILTATLSAVHKHAELLRASIGSAGNDERLGGHEAPPAVISVYLGAELEKILCRIEESDGSKESAATTPYDLGLPPMPDLTRDNTDRNRTSPFAFTGNKFEFRAVGSAASPSFPATVLNVIVAEQLNLMLDEFDDDPMPVIKKYLMHSKPIRFSGDNYSGAWLQEAQKRGLPNISSGPKAFEAYLKPETHQAFKGILNEHELRGRYEVSLEAYENARNIESNLLHELCKTQVLPAAIKTQHQLARSIKGVKAVHRANMKRQIHHLNVITEAIEELLAALEENSPQIREKADFLETLCDDEFWLLPKYRELLFMV